MHTWIPKSTPRPMKRIAKAIETTLRLPTAKAAKASVQIRPTTRVTSTASTRRAERSASASTPAMPRNEREPITSTWRATSTISSVLSATLPVIRTRTPFSGVSPSAAAASRTARMAVRPGSRRS
jgi:hypothetical protein